jgi:hypothetical protein
MTRKEELQAIIDKAREEYQILETIDKYAKNKEKLGRYYKYQDGYNNDDQWWMYLLVNKIDDDGDLFVLSFEINNDGRIIISQEKDPYTNIIAGALEIYPGEFSKAWQFVFNKVKEIDVQLHT